jgi:hypothetical protein
VPCILYPDRHISSPVLSLPYPYFNTLNILVQIPSLIVEARKLQSTLSAINLRRILATYIEVLQHRPVYLLF